MRRCCLITKLIFHGRGNPQGFFGNTILILRPSTSEAFYFWMSPWNSHANTDLREKNLKSYFTLYIPTKKISKRGSVLKVRGGRYNYRFKLYKWLKCGYKNSNSKFNMSEPLKWGMLRLCKYFIFSVRYSKCIKSSILSSGPNITSEHPSYLFSLHTYIICTYYFNWCR